MKTIELFSGTRSFSKVANLRGHSTFTIDNNPEFEPDVCCDILNLLLTKEFNEVDILWASPPCTSFSVASISSSWIGNYHPKRVETALGMAYVLKTLEIIKEIQKKNPNLIWFHCSFVSQALMISKHNFSGILDRSILPFNPCVPVLAPLGAEI